MRDQLAAFRRQWRKVNLRYARSKNLTPYDVLIIASMIEKETVAPEERRLVAAVIYNRLRNRMPLGIDATIRYGLDVPGTEPLKQSRHREQQPVQHAQAPRAAADADLEPRPRVDARRRAARRVSTTSTSSASRDEQPPLLHGERVGVLPEVAGVRLRRLLSSGCARPHRSARESVSGATKLVGIIGWPVEHSLSPRMHNAAFAALGLDWAYVALPTPPSGSRRPCAGSPRSGSPART